MKKIQLPTVKKMIQALAFFALTLSASAGLREPDAVVWGRIIIDRVPMTAANTDVVIEARRTPSGPAIASYQMGGLTAVGDFYSLRLIVESGAPLNDPNAVLEGDHIILVVKNASGDRDSKPLTVAGRGTLTHLDFGALDSDNNGLLDDWEARYFPGIAGINPSADPDGDGASNLREFQEGTDPTVKDARHPADRNPIDGRITINEVTSYGLAWRNNLSWPVGPSPVDIAYVTKAGALWKGGEGYRLDINISTTAPLWWTNLPVVGLMTAEIKPQKAKAEAPSRITRALAPAPGGNAQFIVTLDVTPGTGVAAFAVEEKIPSGWTATEISDGGTLSQPQSSLRWGLYLDGVARNLSYRLAPLGTVTRQLIQFDGLASFDGLNVAAGGIATLADPTGGLILGITGRSSSGGTTLTVTGIPGQLVTIDASSDLEHWNTFQDVTIGANGSAQISIASGSGAEFFRASAGISH